MSLVCLVSVVFIREGDLSKNGGRGREREEQERKEVESMGREEIEDSEEIRINELVYRSGIIS